MPHNREVKARIASSESARELAESLHAKYAGTLHQTDTYFDVSRGRLKLREIDGARAELISYEREESSTRRDSRFELFTVQNPAKLKSLLEASCGIRGIVEKTRVLYLMDGTTRIHLDEVKHLGSFLEFEVPVSSDAEAAEQIEFLIKHFRIGHGDFLKNSYIDLLLERIGSAPKTL
jgi:predicted adenylyl cyclase CyaB